MKAFERVRLTNIELKNRFIRSATSERLCLDNGHLSEAYYQHYEKLAQGGAAMLITGYTYPDEAFKVKSRMAGFYDDSFIPEYQRLTALAHCYDTKLLLQLVHGGSSSSLGCIESASAIPHISSGLVPEAMSKERLKTITNIFVTAAIRAERCGFDGIQIHAAHGYLFSQFLDPRMNQRMDEYGGPISNRARLLVEVIKAIDKQVSKHFHISVKVHCSDFNINGMCFDEALELCGLLTKAGVDSIEISGGDYAARKGELFYQSEAALIAEKVNIPVFLVGGVRSLKAVEKLLCTTSIAAVSMSRALLCEPNLVNAYYYGKKASPDCLQCRTCQACILPSKHAPALFVSDVDGTISMHGVISKADVAAVNQYAKHNYLAFISGRSLSNLKCDLDKHKINYDFLGAYNGAYLIDRCGKVLIDHPLAIEMEELFELISKFQIKGYALTGKAGMYFNIMDTDSIMNKMKTSSYEPQIEQREVMKQLYSVNIEFRDDSTASLFIAQAEALKLNCQIYLNTHFVDIVAYRTGKLEAVKCLQSALGLEREAVTVIGDSFNDLPMIEAYNSFAISSGDLKVIKAAANQADSVEAAIHHIMG